MSGYCEICGRLSKEPLKPIDYHGERLLACSLCQPPKDRLDRRTSEPVSRPPPSVISPARFHDRPIADTSPPKTETEVLEDISAVLRQSRESRGLTISELAERLGIKESVLRRIEAGRLTPDVATVEKIEKYLKLSLRAKQVEGTFISPTEAAARLEFRHIVKLKDSLGADE